MTAKVLVRLIDEGFVVHSQPGLPYTAIRGEVRFSPAPALVAIANGTAEAATWREAAAAAGIDAVIL